jgi:hypothetical protein
MLMAVDEIRRAAEHFLERRELHHQFGADDFGIEPPQQARAQQFAGNGRNMPPSSGLKVHRQRTERRGQRGVQADGAARAVRRASCSALTSSRPIAGPTTITEVALRRPRSIRSRMARLTPGLRP